jgi:hypothetical protein
MMFFHLPVIILSLVIIVDYIYTIQLEIKDTRCLATGRWFSPGTPVSSNNKSDRHGEIGFASFYYDVLVYDVDLVRSCISGIIDWLGLVYGV